MDIYRKLEELNITLPIAPTPAGLYTQVLPFGDKLCYMSGCGSTSETCQLMGKLGAELTLEQGQAAARSTAINMLAVLHRDLGDLNRIKRWVKVLGFVSSDPTFYEQPAVMNGASQLILDVFGEGVGRPARSAIGAPCLPGNIPVEIEALIELEA